MGCPPVQSSTTYPLRTKVVHQTSCQISHHHSTKDWNELELTVTFSNFSDLMLKKKARTVLSKWPQDAQYWDTNLHHLCQGRDQRSKILASRTIIPLIQCVFNLHITENYIIQCFLISYDTKTRKIRSFQNIIFKCFFFGNFR